LQQTSFITLKLREYMKKLLLAPVKLLDFLFGRFRWSPPTWLVACFSFFKKHLKIVLSLLVIALIAIGLYFYVQSLPKPVSAKAELLPILIDSSRSGTNRKPAALDILFDYDFEKLHEDQEKPEGKPSMARIDLVKKQVKDGITIKPAKAGVWKWESDFYLRFEPETRWPSDTEYEVHLDESIFGGDILK